MQREKSRDILYLFAYNRVNFLTSDGARFEIFSEHLFDEEGKKNKPFGLCIDDAEVHGLMYYAVERQGFALAQQALTELAEFLGCEDLIEVLIDCDDVFHRLASFRLSLL